MSFGSRQFARMLGPILLLIVAGGAMAGPEDDGPAVAGNAVRLEVEGPIGPAASDYLLRGIQQAEEGGAAIVILRIDTPGGLDTSMRAIVAGILAADVPVVGHVAPDGARAASAGTFILYATHVAAMAPSTNLGAATPVQVGGGGLPFGGRDREEERPRQRDGDGTQKNGDAEAPPADRPRPALGDKAVSDAAAYIRALAELRGRNADWGERAVTEAVSLTAREAEREGVIDLVAADERALLAALDGRVIQLRDREVRLSTGGMQVVPIAPDWRTRLLAVITNPNVAYILMMIGIYGLILEFYNPGTFVAGTVGAVSLLLALYGLNVLPVNYAGLALMVVGLALIVGEAFAPGFGILGLGGIAAFVLGSLMLIDTDVPGFTVSLPLIGSTAAVAAAGMLLLLAMLRRSRRRAVVTGAEEMIGLQGTVVDWAATDGHVHVHGERWRARAASPLVAGERVRVLGLEGLTLLVAPAASAKDSPAERREP